MVIAPYPSEGILLDVRNPKGESVLVLPKQDYVLAHKQVQHPVYRQVCYIEGDKIIAGEGYYYDSLHPVVMEDFSIAQKQVEPTQELWK